METKIKIKNLIDHYRNCIKECEDSADSFWGQKDYGTAVEYKIEAKVLRHVIKDLRDAIK